MSTTASATSIADITGATVSGTDVFTYTVRDRLGKTATATVRVGVAPAATSNQRPVAVPDQVNIRPGTLVSIPVLDNDVDLDGDDLDLVADMVGAVDPAIEMESKDSRIRTRFHGRKIIRLSTFVIALVKVLLEQGWIKNVLFLADRKSLVTQAKRNFVNLLSDLSVTNLCEEKDNYAAQDGRAHV